MNILWHLRPRYDSVSYGSNLRFFNLTREMAALGHKIYFLLDDYSSDDDSLRESFVARLRTELPIADVFYANYVYPRVRSAIAHKLVHPALVNRIMRGPQSRLSEQVGQVIDDCGIDIYISSVRGRLWLLVDLQPRAITVVEWTDSYILAALRDLRIRVKERTFRGMGGALKLLGLSVMQESYYGRRSNLSLVVSPVDKSWIDRFAGAPEKTHVIYNGVKLAPPPMRKRPKQLIFSGRMDFPPNYQSALWFIDRVLPLVTAREPAVELVIAGPNPVPGLRARGGANVRVAGFTEDLGADIAASQLYVAPMVSGSGFKNKVVEAVAYGTFVAGTSMAFEFLDRDFQGLFLSGDTPEELAGHILRFLESPSQFDSRLERAREIIAARFQWGMQAERLLKLFGAAIDARAGGQFKQASTVPT